MTIIIYLFYVQVYALPLCYLNIWFLHCYAMRVYAAGMLCQPVSQLAKCHTKRCLELQNNTADHTTFVGVADMSAGLVLVAKMYDNVWFFYNSS